MVLKKEPKIDMDFYDIMDIGVYIVNQRVYELLLPLLDETVEILIRSDDSDYYLLNIILSTDCLDKENSEYTALPSGQIMEYNFFVLIHKKNNHRNLTTCNFYQEKENIDPFQGFKKNEKNKI